MSMNRETKRMLQRQGQVRADGTPVATPREKPARKERTSVLQFLREVKGELRKVAWPTRPEVIHYSIVVLITLIIVAAFIAGVDVVFGNLVLGIYDR